MLTLENRVIAAVAVQTGSVVDIDDTFDGLLFDSLDAVELTMLLEDEFGVEIPDDDYAKWDSVKDVVEYVKGRMEI